MNLQLLCSLLVTTNKNFATGSQSSKHIHSSFFLSLKNNQIRNSCSISLFPFLIAQKAIQAIFDRLPCSSPYSTCPGRYIYYGSCPEGLTSRLFRKTKAQWMFPPTELSDQWPQFYGRHGGSFYIIFQDKQQNRMLDIHYLDNTYK